MHGLTREQTLEFNRSVIEAFRANAGQMPEGHPLFGNPMLLLTVTGAKSKRRLTCPLSYASDGAAFLVMASAGGSPALPAWGHNLRADPEVMLEVGTETFAATAVETEGGERDRVFALMTTALPRFAAYQDSVERIIPVFRLERR